MTPVKGMVRKQSMKEQIQALYLTMDDPTYEELAAKAEELGVFTEDWNAARYRPAQIQFCREVVARPGTGELPLGLPLTPAKPEGSKIRVREKCSKEVRNRSLTYRCRSEAFDHIQTQRLYEETTSLFKEARPIWTMGMAVEDPEDDGTVRVQPLQLTFIDVLFPLDWNEDDSA